ncbi:hypothetical protein E4U39_006861 [Claviceps sp. Clav50 group G5]|nr:hypothetical protein E4U39_006861 [Claviceps sp. Clav50 group G5]
MCSDEPMSTDDMSNTSDDAKSKPGNRLCLIDDLAEKPCGESSRFQDGDTAPDTFPQFMRFPPELRLQVWHFYCPDLGAKARILPFFEFPSRKVVYYNNNYSLPDEGALARQTKNLRAMLSTHRESRSIAVRKYPDELLIETASGAGIVRFRKETDVIYLSEVVMGEDYSILDFGSEIENLAVGVVNDYNGERYFRREMLLQVVPEIRSLFPNLKRLFSRRSAPTSTKIWRSDFVRSSVPKLCSVEEMEEAGVELWPMVEFESWKPLLIPDGSQSEDDSSSTSIYSYDDSTADDIDSDDDSNADGTDSDDDSSAENTNWSDSDDDSDADSIDSEDY